MDSETLKCSAKGTAMGTQERAKKCCLGNNAEEAPKCFLCFVVMA